uniref:hypothetical chloroplast RF19 n=1 Tax=Adromischus cristatus TaxID=1713640 RepID=UPI002E789828|nr:hypothetical chloroplast RF19 [Adromischus cristatus]WQM99976.1 hypothetical chloroplast RF19 [Adromischus cristatus]
MILTSFLLGNLVALCMKIINSVVVVGLYYGFLTTFSIGPSYLFLLRAQVMEEGTEKKVSATTGFITGQLMMFISIYYAPLHLALGRPHTITVLALPHLLFHFFWNNQKHFFDSRSTNRNSMRNLSIQCVFLNNLIFQLFNYFLLPSSMLTRLVNIYMFRCNNKMLFVTSSFVGWLIGHVLFMKWVGLVLVWIRQNHSIRSNVLIRSNKYLVSEVINSIARIFSIFLFITCVYYLGRIPSSIVLKETSVTEERGESREETDVEIEKTYETEWTKEEQEGFTDEDPSPSLFSEEKEDPDKIDETEEIRVNGKEKTKDEFHFHFQETCYQNSPVSETSYLYGNQETSKLEILKKNEKKLLNTINIKLVALLFDYKRWKRPLRYLKNKKFENSIINEMSQYFFFSCEDNGKKRISFTYPPSLKTFFEMIERKLTFLRSVYKLIDEFERQERETEAVMLEDPGMRSRKAKFVVVFTINKPAYINYKPEQFYLMHYSQQPDFRRNIIIGSIRAQRRKIPILKLSQANVHSPLFLYRLDKSLLSYFDISGLIKLIFRNWMKKTKEFELSEKKDTYEKYKREAIIGIEIAEPQKGILTPQVIRSSILIIQSILRKYIILPSLIIAKNIGRILLFQFPEWSEDFENWDKETHVKCTYSGVELSDLPKNWLSEGIQIKILFPFYLKPWHRAKPEFPQMDRLKMKKKGKNKNFCFLTVWGRTTKQPFGSHKKQPSFFLPIFKELIKKMIKLKTNCFFILKMLKEIKYVGYKLSQCQVLNLYNLRLRSALQYHETSLFLKDEIKNDFGVQPIFDSGLTDKKLMNSGINQWKSWLRNHYQYNISHIRWSGLVPKTWQNQMNHHSRRQNKNKDFSKWNLYEKGGLIRYKKEIPDYGLNSLSNHKGNLKKNSRYDLLSYKSINYENKKNSYIFVLPSQVNNNQKISYNYNTNKRKLFTLGDNNSLGEKTIIYRDKSYFDYRMIHFRLRKRVDIETWIQTNTKNTTIRNYQLIEQIGKRSLFDLTTQQTNPRIQSFFDWLEMNEEFPILNEELWFLPELILLYNTYKLKRWIIPIKSLLLNLNKKKSLSAKKNIALKQNWNLGSVLLNQEKDLSDYGEVLNYTEEDLDFLLTSQLLVQLRWSFFFNLTLMKNIKVYCLLLSLRNPRESALSAIQRGAINLDIMPSQKYVTEWLQKGVFFIEPVRLSVNNPGQFLMYQTIRISLVQKNNYQTNPRYREKMIGNRVIKNYGLLVLETILSPRRRKELRILISFNSKKNKGIDLNLVFCNGNNVKIYGPFLVESNRLDRLKFFLWPTCQLEDLVCMNRYWFNTNTGSSFSMLRIHMYPQF